MGNVRIELNSAGIQDLLKSSEIAAFSAATAHKITQAQGLKHVSDVYVGRTRVNARGVRRATDDRDNNP